MNTIDLSEIATHAPVFSMAEIVIDSDAETVWKILTTFNDWPKWNPDVQKMSFDGDLKRGSVFVWKAGSAKITSTIQVVDPPNKIGWTGKMLGIRAIHVWQIIPLDGQVLVKTGESWNGFIVKVFKKSMQKMLHESLEKGLHYLKSEAEGKA
jgi:hypothetical protein